MILVDLSCSRWDPALTLYVLLAGARSLRRTTTLQLLLVVNVSELLFRFRPLALHCVNGCQIPRSPKQSISGVVVIALRPVAHDIELWLTFVQRFAESIQVSKMLDINTTADREAFESVAHSDGQPCHCLAMFMTALNDYIVLLEAVSCTSYAHYAVRLDSEWATMGTILPLAHQLGMKWKRFLPDDGIIMACDNGHLIHCVLKNGGLHLQYQCTGYPSMSKICTSTENADKLGFGISLAMQR